MSTSQYIVRFSLPSVSTEEPAFDLFATGMDIVGGDLALRPPLKFDRLQARGVNHVRARRNSRQFDDMVLRLTEPLPVGKSLFDRETNYRDAEGRVGALTIKINGQVLYWSKVIAGITIDASSLLPSPLIGFGSVAGSTGALVTQWTFVRLKEGTSS